MNPEDSPTPEAEFDSVSLEALKRRIDAVDDGVLPGADPEQLHRQSEVPRR
jgi:hypothetical protein